MLLKSSYNIYGTSTAGLQLWPCNESTEEVCAISKTGRRKETKEMFFYGEREKINILMQLFKLLPFHMNLIGASENSAKIKLKLISVHGADRLPHIHAAGSAHIKNGLGVFLLPLKAAGALAAAAFVYSAPNMSSPKSLPLINKHIRLC